MTTVPEPVARIAELMSAYRPAWALCGGWAVDAWLGHLTRDHGDVDIAVFVNDEQALFDHLDGWQLIAHDETLADQGTAEPWNGRPLVLPAHIHGRSPDARGVLPDRLDDAARQGFGLDIQLGERSSRDWALNGDPRVAMPLPRCIRQSGWGLPTVAPEVILFFKATLYVGTKNHLRPHDEADFLALLPQLSEGQRGWLREAVSRVYVGEHPWVGRLLR